MGGLMIAGTHSGCGKTTVSLGLLAALKRKGLAVQPFKAGPDFIDSGLHRMVTGRPSRNLDLWMCGDGYVRECYLRNSTDADISVVEGVMGLFDGMRSSAALAFLLELPVILVIDSYGMAETAGAIVRGVRDWGPGTGNGQIDLAGVIFNRVASENHYRRLCDGVRDVAVLGCLPRDLDFEIPHRHLGLTVAEEDPLERDNIDKLAEAVLKYIDVGRLIQICRQERKTASAFVPGLPRSGASAPPRSARIAVARDRAFCFYYEDNLDLLRDNGAQIVFFSPLSDGSVPAGADAIYIGGGYPELNAEALSGNMQMLRAVKRWADKGRPIYAECGGLMYLSQGIYDFDGNFFEMAGVFPFETRMKSGRAKLGYRQISLKDDCILGRKGAVLRGHEFHYSEIKEGPRERKDASTEGKEAERSEPIYSTMNGAGQELQPEGRRYKNTLASYIHIHFGSNPESALNIVRHMRRS